MLGVASLEERIVAILHDVVEDTDWTFDRLRTEGFAEPVLEALDAVTRREGESYEDFVQRAARNPIGRIVKTCRPTRQSQPTAHPGPYTERSRPSRKVPKGAIAPRFGVGPLKPDPSGCLWGVHIAQKLRPRLYSSHEQMVSRTRACHVKQVPFGLVDVVEVGLVGNGLDALL